MIMQRRNRLGRSRDAAADLGRGRIGQRGSVLEENRRNGEIAIVDPSNNCGTIGMIFNVDLMEVDTGAGEL